MKKQLLYCKRKIDTDSDSDPRPRIESTEYPTYATAGSKEKYPETVEYTQVEVPIHPFLRYEFAINKSVRILPEICIGSLSVDLRGVNSGGFAWFAGVGVTY